MADGKLGLVSVGAYVPRYRLTGKLLAQVWGSGGGERAVANYDEDALTMACEAALEHPHRLDDFGEYLRMIRRAFREPTEPGEVLLNLVLERLELADEQLVHRAADVELEQSAEGGVFA